MLGCKIEQKLTGCKTREKLKFIIARSDFYRLIQNITWCIGSTSYNAAFQLSPYTTLAGIRWYVYLCPKANNYLKEYFKRGFLRNVLYFKMGFLQRFRWKKSNLYPVAELPQEGRFAEPTCPSMKTWKLRSKKTLQQSFKRMHTSQRQFNAWRATSSSSWDIMFLPARLLPF